MFYSHEFLRKNGRFGLVWLAATQSRILSRREVIAVRVSVTVSDILQHIPGYIERGVYNRPRRFSLYLSSQLMFGSVKILQKQWDFLLSDLTAFMKRFYPEVSSTNDIDLIAGRQDPVTLESMVPTSIQDKCYDPFFGVFKDNIIDIESHVSFWDDEFVKHEILAIDRSTDSFKPEIGSPYSVSDPREIQILDRHDVPHTISPIIPGEQDLPNLDEESLALIQGADQLVEVSMEEILNASASKPPLESTGVAPSDLLQTDTDPLIFERQHRPVEETPAVKITGEQPGAPQKPKRKLRSEVDHGDKQPRHSAADQPVNELFQSTGDKGSEVTLTDAVTQDLVGLDVEQIQRQEVITSDQTAQEAQVHPRQTSSPDVPEQLLSPEQSRQAGQDWLQKHPKLQLTPIQESPGPVRKRQPHKLIIDETMQLSRLELKKNMMNSNDTCVPFATVLPTSHKKDANYFQGPGSISMRQPKFRALWSRNCRLGLRVTERGTNSTDLSDISPLSPILKRKDTVADYHTPAKVPRTDSLSLLSSIERGRDTSSIMAPNKSVESSKSTIAQASDDSASNITAEAAEVSAVLDQTMQLAPVPEEQEQALQIPAEIPAVDISTNIADQDESRLMRLLSTTTRGKGDKTTFRTLCPPQSSSRIQALRLLQELCELLRKGHVQVQQDEPYGEIYIWKRI